MMRRLYQCPVCGYDRMREPPKSWYICPCCGVEFENDDYEVGHDVLRAEWIASGMPWFSSVTRPPIGWKPYSQLAKAHLLGDLVRFSAPSLSVNISVQAEQPFASHDLEGLVGALTF